MSLCSPERPVPFPLGKAKGWAWLDRGQCRLDRYLRNRAGIWELQTRSWWRSYWVSGYIWQPLLDVEVGFKRWNVTHENNKPCRLMNQCISEEWRIYWICNYNIFRLGFHCLVLWPGLTDRYLLTAKQSDQELWDLLLIPTLFLHRQNILIDEISYYHNITWCIEPLPWEKWWTKTRWRLTFYQLQQNELLQLLPRFTLPLNLIQILCQPGTPIWSVQHITSSCGFYLCWTIFKTANLILRGKRWINNSHSQ